MRQVFRNPTPEANDQSDHLRSRQLPRSGRRGGGCSHRCLRRSAPPTMAVSRKKSCARRSPSAGVAFDAVADKYGSDAGRRLAGAPADGGHRADVAVTEPLREGSFLGFVRVLRVAIPRPAGTLENSPAIYRWVVART